MKRSAWIVITLSLAAILAFFVGQNGTEESEEATTESSLAADSESASPTDRASTTPTTSKSGKILIPSQYRFGGVTDTPVANNYDALLAQYTPEQQSRITDFYQRFADNRQMAWRYATKHIFSFHSLEQLSWLVTAGFPTPEEILLAGEMSDEELHRQAQDGSLKAIGFWLDRVSDTIDTLEEITRMETAALASGSPYAAYISASLNLSRNELGPALASYYLAMELGDGRGSEFGMFLNTINPDINATSTVLMFKVKRMIATNYDRNLFIIQQRGRFPPPPDN